MKKFKNLSVATLIVVVMLCAFAACDYNAVKTTEDVVAVTVSDKVMSLDGKNLVDYLDELVKKGDFSYSASNGMVTTVNGKTADYAADKTSWMIYTSDEDLGNAAWGTYEFEGKTYYSATLGIGDYPLSEGTVILFVFCQF